MSKKLLSERQVRRFQSLASIRPLNEMGMYNEAEEEMDADFPAEEEAPEADMPPMEMDAAEDAPEDAPEMGDADGEQVEVEEEMVEKAMAAIADLQALVDALGGESAPADDMPPMDIPADEPEMDLDAEEPAEDEEEEALLELALEGINYKPSQKELVKVVAKRVAKRLLEAKQAQVKLNKALGKK